MSRTCRPVALLFIFGVILFSLCNWWWFWLVCEGVLIEWHVLWVKLFVFRKGFFEQFTESPDAFHVVYFKVTPCFKDQFVVAMALSLLPPPNRYSLIALAREEPSAKATELIILLIFRFKLFKLFISKSLYSLYTALEYGSIAIKPSHKPKG